MLVADAHIAADRDQTQADRPAKQFRLIYTNMVCFLLLLQKSRFHSTSTWQAYLPGGLQLQQRLSRNHERMIHEAPRAVPSRLR